MNKTPVLIAVFSLFCAVPALAANGTNAGQFHALSGLSDMHHQEIIPLSDQELNAVEGQGHLVLVPGSLVHVNVQDVNVEIIRDVTVQDIEVNVNILGTQILPRLP